MQIIRSFAQQAMETLAYLYLAVNYEVSPDIKGVETRLKLDKMPIQLLYRCSLALFSFSMVLGVWGTGSQGLALIQQGDRSLQVQEIQERLQNLGYFSATPTGYFGPITRNAILKFQKAQGLTPDGIVGTKTQVALIRCRNPKTTTIPQTPLPNYQKTVRLPEIQLTIAKFNPISPTTQVNQKNVAPIAQNTSSDRLELGSSGEQVEALQQRLDLLGYYRGEITGEFDELTQAAVIAFQRDRRLVADGVVGRQTRAALQNPLPREQVMALQQRLKKAGLYSGEVDGVWGPLTQRALEEAQNTYNIQASDLLR